VAVILSQHTAREMGRRGIAQAYIEAVVSGPAYTTPDPNDPTLVRAFAPVAAFGGRMLRVVYRRQGDDIFVVTATWDRGARR
jgi:hypothetical protein